ncbi:hypothetical protein EDB83DRAFT_2602861 [Lactarius deliciosus]|nr:hypothetical protein EDB83DRAFT_2602861 [Lactarius deliciosus]
MIQARLTCLITKSATQMLRTSASLPHDPWHEDAMTTSLPTLSSLAWLTASATMHARHPVRFVVVASLCQGRQYERALHPRSHDQLVEEEVRRCEAEDKRFVFVLNIVDARECSGSTSAPRPTMSFRSVGSHQCILSSDSSPVSLFGVVIFLSADKGSPINTLKRVWKVRSAASQLAGRTKELLQYVQLERTLRIIDSSGVVFDHKGIHGQDAVLYSYVTWSN